MSQPQPRQPQGGKPQARKPAAQALPKARTTQSRPAASTAMETPTPAAPPKRAQVQIIKAPLRPPITGQRTVFLAGSTAGPEGANWRAALAEQLSALPITLFDPLRPDWDSTWREDPAFAPFRQQVEWELDMQGKADVVVLYFGPATDAPISLLELGLCARAGKALVVCHGEYRKRGNVRVLCAHLGLQYLDGASTGEMAAAVRERVRKLGVKG